MPLTGVHVLLSYQCTHECDHCFVWASPRAGGTITLELLLDVIDQARPSGYPTAWGSQNQVHPSYVFDADLRENVYGRAALTNSLKSLPAPPSSSQSCPTLSASKDRRAKAYQSMSLMCPFTQA